MKKNKYLRLKKAAKAFVDKFTAIMDSDEYKGVWTLAAAHGIPYKGDNVSKEWIELCAILKEDE